MRFGFFVMVALAIAACDDIAVIEPEAAWSSSIGRLVADGEDPSALEFVHLDGAGPEQGRMTLISGNDIDVGEAARLETLVQPPSMESLQARLLTTADIDAEATCWLRFNARAVQPQIELTLGRLSISVFPTAPDSEPMLDRLIYLAPVWTPIDFIFTVPTDVAAGDVAIVFGVGTRLQVVDVAAVSMRCFDDDRTIASLPSTSFSYAGRDPKAPWRAAAERQIERYRMSDLSINVTDASGQPVADAEVHIQMSRHAFTFGAVVDPDQLVGGDASDDNNGKTASYRRNLKELFNAATFRDGLHWIAWANPDERQTNEAALAWVRSLGLDLRALGPVASPSLDLPSTLKEKKDVPDAIRKAIRAGIEATAGELEEHVSAWYVFDKPRDNRDSLDLLGLEEVATWLRLTRSVAPDADLALNESEILAGDRMAEYAALLGNLIGEDAPLSRIGIEGQFGAQPPPIQVLSDRLDQLASFDLPLAITGFDMLTTDKRLRQDFARDFLTLAFAHPSVEAFVFRHFWEEDAKSDATAIYRSDGTISPIGNIYRDLVLDRWWTDIVALGDTEGELTRRVFLGDYTVSAQKGDQSAAVTLSLGPEGAEVAIELAAKDESAPER